jgi:hypothetical protein
MTAGRIVPIILAVAWGVLILVFFVSLHDARMTTRLPSRHRLGPGDMPLEAKRSRHVAVAIPEVAVGGFVAASSS